MAIIIYYAVERRVFHPGKPEAKIFEVARHKNKKMPPSIPPSICNNKSYGYDLYVDFFTTLEQAQKFKKEFLKSHN